MPQTGPQTGWGLVVVVATVGVEVKGLEVAPAKVGVEVRGLEVAPAKVEGLSLE